jgi:hypothetical protein
MRYLRTNTAARITVGPFFDKTDGVTPETAITVTSCKLSLMVDDSNVPTLVLDTAPTASGGANDMVHVTGDDSGFYDLELAAANVNYLGRAVLSITDPAVHCPVVHEFMILPANVYDSLVLGTDTLNADVTQFGGTNGTFSAGRPEVNTTHAAGTAWGSGAITAASIATGAVDADALAADAANEIADALLDRTAGVETGYTVRQAMRIMLSAMAAKLSGAATTTVTIRDVGDTKARITATVDSDGNRSAVTLDAT